MKIKNKIIIMIIIKLCSKVMYRYKLCLAYFQT